MIPQNPDCHRDWHAEAAAAPRFLTLLIMQISKSSASSGMFLLSAWDYRLIHWGFKRSECQFVENSSSDPK